MKIPAGDTAKMSRRTRRWIRRHSRRHGQVIISKHVRTKLISDGSMDQDSVILGHIAATATCGLGHTRPAYMETVLAFDGARA